MSKTADVIKREYADYLKADDHIAWLKKISDADERILRIPQEFYRNVLLSGEGVVPWTYMYLGLMVIAAPSVELA